MPARVTLQRAPPMLVVLGVPSSRCAHHRPAWRAPDSRLPHDLYQASAADGDGPQTDASASAAGEQCPPRRDGGRGLGAARVRARRPQARVCASGELRPKPNPHPNPSPKPNPNPALTLTRHATRTRARRTGTATGPGPEPGCASFATRPACVLAPALFAWTVRCKLTGGARRRASSCTRSSRRRSRHLRSPTTLTTPTWIRCSSISSRNPRSQLPGMYATLALILVEASLGYCEPVPDPTPTPHAIQNQFTPTNLPTPNYNPNLPGCHLALLPSRWARAGRWRQFRMVHLVFGSTRLPRGKLRACPNVA